MFVLVGFATMLLILIAAFVLPLIAGIKAYGGESYRYPFTWRLVK